MATISKLKTVNGKYYATEDFVKSYVDENMERIVGESEELNELVSDKVSNRLEEINDIISGKADASNVYTKQQVETIISNIFSMNTIE